MKNQKREGKMCPYDREVKGFWVCMRIPGYKCLFPHNIPKADRFTPCSCRIIAPEKRVKKLFNMGTGEEYKLTKAWAWLSPDGNVCAATIGRCGSQVRCIISVNVKDIEKVKSKFGKITKENKRENNNNS